MDDVTRLADVTTPTTSSTNSGDSRRFAAGTLFAGRFRIVAPLGKGGMGEVYRAEDLKLGQTVALKFLPDDVAHDPVRLAQFHNEVRVARTIAHRNVCRMYDIGDADGRPFLTMESVDGEDLSSLLRRIGRFPQDKAIEVARQLCAGVAAAHERGVLHRDLKPANVMIDGDGQVRITDFGLASAGEAVENIRAGTPAYMAPEQLAGKEVTRRSDIYSLGLILFELFTGRRVFDAKTINELLRAHETSDWRTPSSVVPDLDPTVERAIMRCLERNPHDRPASALAVAAALPGGDQLAAAMAAGETPSPEMVAAAGDRSALRAEIGLAVLAVALVALVAAAALCDRVVLLHRVPITKSTDGLRDRAIDVLERLGYPAKPYDSADGWTVTPSFLRYIARTDHGAERWRVLAAGRAPTVLFWYRTSDRELMPTTARESAVTLDDPPSTVPGMRTIILDPAGRLLSLLVVPYAVREPASAPVDWSVLFDAAGLPYGSFHAAPVRLVPRAYADVTAAFDGIMPDVNLPIHVEAAALGGHPVWFSIVGPWNEPSNGTSPRGTSAAGVFSAGSTIVIGLILAGACILARINYRGGKSDRRGAFRMSAAIFISWAAYLLISGRHSGNVNFEYLRVTAAIAIALYGAAGLWVIYIALEPYVRRFWPQLLIGWSRLMTGQWLDPAVGREVLVGVAVGALIAIYLSTHAILEGLIGPPPIPTVTTTTPLESVRSVVGQLLFGIPRAIISPFQVLFIVVFLKAIVRRTWIVVALTSVIVLPIAITGMFSGERLALDVTYTIVGILIVVGVLLRFGLIALCVTFFVFESLNTFPTTVDVSAPYAATSTWLLLGLAALAGYGFYASRGGEPLFGRFQA